MSQENTATVQEQPKAEPTTAPVELTVQDLGVIRSIIDVASQRGAFKANELEAVGKTFNKLDSFLQAVQKAEADAKEQKEGSEGGK